MKLRLISLAAFAAVSTLAQAGTPLTVAQVQAIPASNTLYIGGSSAAKAIISGLFTQNCDTTTVVNFKSAKASFANDKSDGESYNVYACTLIAGNDWGLTAGQNAVIYKRERGGSVFGVFPVAKNTPTLFTDISTCSDSTKTCTGTVSHTADMGISDEEPTLFNAQFNKPSTFDGVSTGFGSLTVSNSDFAQVTTVFSQVFGLAVSNQLFLDLQAADGVSGSTLPSIPATVAATIFAGNVGDWSTLKNGALAGAGNQINICRRDIGSGTQAASNAFFGQYPFNASSQWLPADGSNTTADIAVSGGGPVIIENVSTGTVQDCFTAANTATTKAYAIGVLGLGTGTTADYKFVKIDGANPTRDDAKVGNYGFYVESTMQINKATTGAKLNFAKQFIAKSQLASNLNSLSTAAQGGVFALPTSGSGTADDCTAVSSFPNPATTNVGTDKFCSRVTRNGSTPAISQFAQ